jgi:LmbE family N-acetylglucosaminyl deacetylase
MQKKVFFTFLILIFCLHDVYPALPLAPKENKYIGPFKKGERVLILAPHPDDEAIGCAGVIQQALFSKAQVKIVYLTNGDHNQIAFIVYEKRPVLRKGEFIHLGEVRRWESIKAMKLLGLNENNLIFLGYPDFGTFTIFTRYWQSKKPFKSLLTRISSVPYKENLSFQAPYVGESILSDLKKVILAYRPDKIFVSHPADTNVDHRSLYLFLQIALRDLEKKIPEPKIYPYLIHCIGWPLPRHYHPELTLEPPQKFKDSQIDWLKYELTKEQLNKKYQAILCYKSQTSSSAFYLLAFARKNELFGNYHDVEVPKQATLEEASFYGSSNMYVDSDIRGARNVGQIIEGKDLIGYTAFDDYFFIRIKKAQTLSRKLSFMVYLFGYNSKIPFSSMPKIRIIVKNKKFKVLDKGKPIKPEGISLELNSSVLILKVPFAALGSPEFLLTSLKAYGGIFPVAASAFRKIEIK